MQINVEQYKFILVFINIDKFLNNYILNNATREMKNVVILFNLFFRSVL